MQKFKITRNNIEKALVGFKSIYLTTFACAMSLPGNNVDVKRAHQVALASASALEMVLGEFTNKGELKYGTDAYIEYRTWSGKLLQIFVEGNVVELYIDPESFGAAIIEEGIASSEN